MAVEKKYDSEGKIVEEAKKPCMQRISTAASETWKSKPPSEWAQLVSCFVVFYLFMSGWMGIHMYVMHENLPRLVEWEHNTLKLGQPRSGRFHVSGFVYANDAASGKGDTRSPKWEPAQLPYHDTDEDKVPVGDRDIFCATVDNKVAAECTATQQLRTLNQWTERKLAMDLNFVCYVDDMLVDGVQTDDVNAFTTTITDFTDPLVNATGFSLRTFPESQPHLVPTGVTEAYNASTNYHTKIVTSTGTPKDVVHLKFFEGAYAPHFTQFQVGVSDIKEFGGVPTKKVEVQISCQVQFFPNVKNVFQFDDNIGEDDDELAEIDGIDKASFRFIYHLDKKDPTL